MLFTKIYNWFFDVSIEERSALKIILWWESRRILFNILIGVVGIISLALLFIFVDSSVKGHSGEDIVEPAAIFLAPFALNFFYTFGWIVEITLGRIWKKDEPKLATKLLKFGMGLSLLIVLVPSVVWGIIFVLTKFGLSK
jgi:hypothetical protein